VATAFAGVHAGSALAAAPTIDSSTVQGHGSTFAECGNVIDQHSDSLPSVTGSGPFSVSHTFAPADATAGCGAGSGTDQTSGSLSSTGAIDQNGVLKLSDTSQGSTTATTSYVGDPNNDCLDVGASIGGQTNVVFTITDPTPFSYTGTVSSSGHQADGSGTVGYSLVRTSSPAATIFDQHPGSSPNIQGTLDPGTYQYVVNSGASNDFACDKSGTETDSISYNVRLLVGTVAPPVNTVPPAISGAAAVGQTLTCSNGSWDNNPTSFAYQWNQDGTPISGATNQTYVVGAGDQGHTLTCTVTATNDGGDTPATSAGLAIPAPAAGAPVNTAPPSISGTPHPGRGLTCSQGSWTNNPTAFAVQWSRDGTPIAGARTATYTVQNADQGHHLTCTVTASNTSGAGTPSSSAPVAVPAATAAPKCRLSSTGKVSARRGAGGTLPVTVRCDQNASVSLAAVLADVRAAHHGHRPKTKRFRLGRVHATVGAGQRAALTFKLPAAAVNDLVHGAKQSVSIALTASNPNGTSRSAARISPLRI
jgi:hypothetical protein